MTLYAAPLLQFLLSKLLQLNVHLYLLPLEAAVLLSTQYEHALLFGGKTN
jgi:hypothetical protein